MLPSLDDILRRRPYNAVSDFVDANVERGLGEKVAFADGDMLQFLFRFQSSGSNCSNSVAWSTTLAQPSQITVATIVPEGIAALLPLALAVPLAARWWKRRQP